MDRSTLRLPLRLALFALLGAFAAEAGLRFFTRSGELQAGTALRLSTSGLVDGADLIVEGRVLATQAVRQEDGTIDTRYELAVERTLLGADLPERSLVLPGGVLPNGDGMLLPGIEHPPIGARLLWFLSAPGVHQRRMPIGLSQGCWRLVPTPEGGQLALRGAAGVGLLDPGAPEAAQSSVALIRPYAELLAEVHAALAAREAREAGR